MDFKLECELESELRIELKCELGSELHIELISELEDRKKEPNLIG